MVNECTRSLHQVSGTIPESTAEWVRKVKDEALDSDLNQLAGLLHKYGHDGQATVVDEIRATLAATPDYQRLAGIDVWGGAGAVWEVNLAQSAKSTEARTDGRPFCQTVIRVQNIWTG